MQSLKLIVLLFTFVNIISPVTAQTEVNSLLPMEFKVLSEKTKGTIIDVRNKDEYDFAHIEHAVQIGVESDDFLANLKDLECYVKLPGDWPATKLQMIYKEIFPIAPAFLLKPEKEKQDATPAEKTKAAHPKIDGVFPVVQDLGSSIESLNESN